MRLSDSFGKAVASRRGPAGPSARDRGQLDRVAGALENVNARHERTLNNQAESPEGSQLVNSRGHVVVISGPLRQLQQLQNIPVGVF
jgi:hypothetical protein